MTSHEYPGLFVAFEGGEGAGKSTQIEFLAAALTAAGQSVAVTREPGGTALGIELRRLLLQRPMGLGSYTEAALFAADRAHHVETVIRPALAAGKIVLCDRYIDSSIAYQGAALGLGTSAVTWLSGWVTQQLLPDLTVLLDIDPKVGLNRAAGNGPGDAIEARTLEFHEKVRDAFLARARVGDGTTYLVLDAAGEPYELADTIDAAVWFQITSKPALRKDPTDARP